jgi:hypothetical protein
MAVQLHMPARELLHETELLPQQRCDFMTPVCTHIDTVVVLA